MFRLSYGSLNIMWGLYWSRLSIRP